MATTNAVRDPTWVDLNATFVATQDQELLNDSDAIKQSIRSILLTPIGSRPYEREYGSRLRWLLFEPQDALTEEDIKASILQALERWEPRILLDTRRTLVQADPALPGYTIEVYYSELLTKNRESVTFSVREL